VRKFVVEYALKYDHVVQVGIVAGSEEKALEKAKKAFDTGSIWSNTKKMPLLMDMFEEVDGPLEFRVIEECEAGFPKPDSSVVRQAKETAAMKVAAILVLAYKAGEKNGGSMDWSTLDVAFEIAAKAGITGDEK